MVRATFHKKPEKREDAFKTEAYTSWEESQVPREEIRLFLSVTGFLDQTLLLPDLSPEMIRKLCDWGSSGSFLPKMLQQKIPFLLDYPNQHSSIHFIPEGENTLRLRLKGKYRGILKKIGSPGSVTEIRIHTAHFIQLLIHEIKKFQTWASLGPQAAEKLQTQLNLLAPVEQRPIFSLWYHHYLNNDWCNWPLKKALKTRLTPTGDPESLFLYIELYGRDGLPLSLGANTAWLLSLTCKPDNRDNFEGLLSGKTVKFYFWNRPGTLWLEPSNDTLQIRVKNYFRLPEGNPEGIQTEITVSIEKFLDECFALSPSLIQLYQGLGLESHHLVNGYPVCYQLWQKLRQSRPSDHSSPTTN